MADVHLDWVLKAAHERFLHHGRELFRIRVWALRVPALLAFGGACLAKFVAGGSKPLAILLVGMCVLPAIAVAPGLVAATVAVARDRRPSRWLLADYAFLAPRYALLALAHLAIVGAANIGLAGFYVSFRMSLARYLMVDRGLGVFAALRESATLTRGAALKRAKVSVTAAFDDLEQYGLLRAGIDGPVRAAIADALVYDYLSGYLAPSDPPAVEAGTAGDALPVARVVDAEDDPGGGPRCPRCRTDLVAKTEPTVLLACPSCAGMWLDIAASTALLENRLVVTESEPLVEERNRPPRATPTRCPTCRAGMQRTFVATGQVTVDACPAHGTWFDHGEVTAVARAVAQAVVDRRELATLLANKDAGNVYLRGAGVIAKEAASGALAAGRASVDTVIQGSESERDAMLVYAADTGIDILSESESTDPS